MEAVPGAWYRWQDDCLLLNCRIQPRASCDEFAEVLDDAIKVRITAPPVDGKANTHLIKFLARAFKVPKQHVEILKGESNRQKLILIRKPQRLPWSEKS